MDGAEEARRGRGGFKGRHFFLSLEKELESPGLHGEGFGCGIERGDVEGG